MLGWDDRLDSVENCPFDDCHLDHDLILMKSEFNAAQETRVQDGRDPIENIPCPFDVCHLDRDPIIWKSKVFVDRAV